MSTEYSQMGHTMETPTFSFKDRMYSIMKLQEVDLSQELFLLT